MRGTNTIVCKILTCLIISVLLLGYLPAQANAGNSFVDHTTLHTPASWPTSFIAYTDANGNIITDENGEINPDYADITSGPTISGTSPAHGSKPSVYMNSDGTNMFFRMRIGANPVNINNNKFKNTNYIIAIGTFTVTNNHWDSALVIGFNANANGSYVYLTKDGNSITRVYNVTATDAHQGAEVVPISDGTGQYFLDFQVPIRELKEFTDTNGNPFQGTTPIRLFYATSQANNLAVINKDMMVGTLDYGSGETITPEEPPVSNGDVEVLEVQPGTSYDLTTSYLEGRFPGRTVNLTQMSMPEFISKVDEINGKYDVVYVGNNTVGGAYTARGTEPTWLPVCKTPTRNGSETNSQEYYSENDITNRRAATLKNFINSKQLTIFDQSILGTTSSLKNTKLNANFSSYVTGYPNNFKTVDRNNNALLSSLNNAFAVYTNAGVAKRPVLAFASNGKPIQYDGSDGSYSTVNYLGYAYNISNLNNAAMKVELYIDVNGDGIFSNSEIVSAKDYANASVSGSLNYPLPDSFVGLQPWKLEVADKSTGAKSYKLGNTAFKATNSEGALKVRVLQLEPSGNTLSIYSLHNVKNPDTNRYVNLLAKDKVYNIEVTEMSVANFNAAYNNLQTGQTPKPVSATVNGISKSVPTILNGNYDMVVMGFNDSYGCDDLNANAIQALQSFIQTNQSVMFTHDTMQYHLPIDVASFPGTYNLTNSFRQLVGQQRYYHANEMSDSNNRTYDTMPDTDLPLKNSYGYSDRLFDRFKTGSRVGLDTTTQAYKVNDNFVTQFPFVLGNIPVATTHYQWYQLDLEDPNVVPVYTLYDGAIYNNQGDGRNDYYTYTKGNITYSGTGHSVPNGFPEEEMFVNTMLKASRGANHAPTLVVNGISNGMNISNTLPSINFNFMTTDIDLMDRYLNADIYLSTSTDGTNFNDYTNVQHFSATDANTRVTSGVAQSVSVPTVNSNIKAYKVRVVASDSYNAQASQEIEINSVNGPSITVTSPQSPTACLVGDTIQFPVNVTAQPNGVSENFTNISLQGILTNPNNSSSNVYNPTYDDLLFNPNPSWTTISKSYPITFGTQGDPNSAGVYVISNQLSYKMNNIPVTPNPITSSVTVYSGTIGVDVSDQNGKPIPDVSLKLVKDKDGSLVATGTTTSTGYFAFTGLGSGDYTVTVDPIPNGRTLEISSSKVSLSADYHVQSVNFRMGGDLIKNPSIKTQNGSSQMSILKDIPLQTVIGFDLSRDVRVLKIALKLDLIDRPEYSSDPTKDPNNSLEGSTLNVALSDMFCKKEDTQQIAYNMDTSIPGIIVLTRPDNIPFSSGIYAINANVTINGGTMKDGQNFAILLTDQTSAQDAITGSIENIASVSLPLTVKVGTAPPLH